VVGVLDHNRAGSKVAKSLPLAVDEKHSEPDPISVGKEVDDPDHVPDACLREGHGLAPIAHHSQTEGALAERLPRPQRFADPEVAKDDNEGADDVDQGGDRVGLQHGAGGGGEEHHRHQDAGHDQEVQELCDASRAQARHLVVE